LWEGALFNSIRLLEVLEDKLHVVVRKRERRENLRGAEGGVSLDESLGRYPLAIPVIDPANGNKRLPPNNLILNEG
jgi:hypothetical protein